MVRNLNGGGDSGSFETDNDNFTFTIQTEDVMTIKNDSLTLNMFDDIGMLKIDNNNVSVVDVDLEALEIQVNTNTSNIATNSNNILTNTNNIQSNSNNIYINSLDILSNKSRLTAIEDPAFLLPLTLDKVNNRVGINNTTPTSSLHVLGDVRTTNNFICGNTLQTNNISASGTATIDGNAIVNNNVSASSFIGSGASLTNLNASNITSGILGVVRGGTGVNTSTGTGSVVLNNNPSFSSSITVNGNGFINNAYIGNYASGNLACFKHKDAGILANDYAILQDITGTTFINSSSGRIIQFRNNNSLRTMTIMSNGNVGIGTETPTEKLDVEGNARINDAYVGNYSGGSFATFKHKDAGTLQNDYAIIQDSVGRTLINSSSGQMIQFRNNNSQRMTIASNGNLGIGTTSPLEKLHVIGNVLATAFSRQFDTRNQMAPDDIGNASFSFGFGSYNNNNTSPLADVLHLNSWSDGSGGATNAIYFNKGGFGIRQYRGTFGSATGYTSYNDCVMADSSGNVNITGNVGIGTTTPTQKLHVIGNGILNNAYIGNYASGNLACFKHKDAGILADDYAILQDITGTTLINSSSGQNIQFRNNNSLRTMTIMSNGNVGIGTETPTEKLHVNGNTLTTNLRCYNEIVSGIQNVNTSAGAILGGIEFNNGGNNIRSGIRSLNDAGGDNNANLCFYTSFSYDSIMAERMRITRGGNVGIGTTNPAFKFVVNGGDVLLRNGFFGSYTSGNWSVFKHIDTDLQTGYAIMQESTGRVLINSPTGQMIQFRNNNGQRMTIASNGNVGIGTETPTEKLEVNGNIKCDQIRHLGINTTFSTGIFSTFTVVSNRILISMNHPAIITSSMPIYEVSIAYLNSSNRYASLSEDEPDCIIEWTATQLFIESNIFKYDIRNRTYRILYHYLV